MAICVLDVVKFLKLYFQIQLIISSVNSEAAKSFLYLMAKLAIAFINSSESFETCSDSYKKLKSNNTRFNDA